jgi:hypothetical protein
MNSLNRRQFTFAGLWGVLVGLFSGKAEAKESVMYLVYDPLTEGYYVPGKKQSNYLQELRRKAKLWDEIMDNSSSHHWEYLNTELDRLIRWIPVEERLPEVDNKANISKLVQFVSKHGRHVGRCNYNPERKGWWDHILSSPHAYNQVENVTHWAELPNGPGGLELKLRGIDDGKVVDEPVSLYQERLWADGHFPKTTTYNELSKQGIEDVYLRPL